MPVTIIEMEASRRLNDNGAQRSYVITEATSEENAKSELETFAPADVAGFTNRNVDIEEKASDHGLYFGFVSWESAESISVSSQPKETTPTAYSFTTRGERIRIKQSKQTMASYFDSNFVDAAPNHGGLINVTKDGVEGTEIYVPVYSFGETHYMSVSAGNALKSTLYNLTGKVNGDLFRGFAAGQVLFLGASGRQQGDSPWEINMQFLYSPNVTNISVGQMTVASKAGWNYLWVLYSEAEDTAAKFITRKPIAAYVERVYEQANFVGLPS